MRCLSLLSLFLSKGGQFFYARLVGMESIVFGGGCFWCVETLFKRVSGVTKLVSGYAGGSMPNPTYAQVCSGSTGHAEVLQVTFDPNIITLANILQLFFEAHDPTTRNQQGGDVGTQYRSIILYKDDTQKHVAEAIKNEAQANWKDPIVTEIVPLKEFFPAEEYHQDYYAKNPNQPYCVAVISPKLEKFLKNHPENK